VELARKIQQEPGARYLRLPSKFDVHEWAIMDRFCYTIQNAHIRDDLHSGIRGAGAFRMFKRLLSEYKLWEAWSRFRQAELRQMAIEWCEEQGVAYRKTYAEKAVASEKWPVANSFGVEGQRGKLEKGKQAKAIFHFPFLPFPPFPLTTR